MGGFKFGRNSKAELEPLHSDIQLVMNDAIRVSPIDFGIPKGTGGLRSAELQHSLFLAGKSKCDGYKKRSKHQDGLAVDVYAYVGGKASWKPRHLALIAGVILSCAGNRGIEMRWGGTFGSRTFLGWDYPHFELI